MGENVGIVLVTAMKTKLNLLPFLLATLFCVSCMSPMYIPILDTDGLHKLAGLDEAIRLFDSENQRWPKDASEITKFAAEQRLEFKGEWFMHLEFVPLAEDALQVKYVIAPHDWQKGQLTIRRGESANDREPEEDGPGS